MSVLFLALGGFFLGGAISVWRAEGRGRRGTVVAVLLMVIAALCVVTGVLRWG